MLPLVLLGLGFASIPGAWPAWGLAMAAIALAASYYPRLAAVRRFRQSLAGGILHPVGIFLLVAIQWYALARNQLGRPANWKGRAYPARPVLEAAHVERRIS